MSTIVILDALGERLSASLEIRLLSSSAGKTYEFTDTFDKSESPFSASKSRKVAPHFGRLCERHFCFDVNVLTLLTSNRNIRSRINLSPACNYTQLD